MKVYRTDKLITRDKVRLNPDVLYLFGDNSIRKGLGGQAREMRGEPNCMGIVTKRFPSNKTSSFYMDFDWSNWNTIAYEDVINIIYEIRTGRYKALVIPKIGQGLAKLEENAPSIWKTLNIYLNDIEREALKI